MHKIQFLLVALGLKHVSSLSPPPSAPHHIFSSLCHIHSNPLLLLPASTQSGLAISGQNILDPRQKSAHLGVNPGVVGLGAALAPGDDTVQLMVTHKGTARVTLSNGGEEFNTALQVLRCM